MKADKVYLVTYHQDDKAQKYVDKIILQLSNFNIDAQSSYFDIWDFYQCIENFRTIISQEVGNNIYMDISTGAKITAITGMLSCMLWNAEPYYAKLEYSSNNIVRDVQKVVDITPLP